MASFGANFSFSGWIFGSGFSRNYRLANCCELNWIFWQRRVLSWNLVESETAETYFGMQLAINLVSHLVNLDFA